MRARMSGGKVNVGETASELSLTTRKPCRNGQNQDFYSGQAACRMCSLRAEVFLRGLLSPWPWLGLHLSAQERLWPEGGTLRGTLWGHLQGGTRPEGQEGRAGTAGGGRQRGLGSAAVPGAGLGCCPSPGTERAITGTPALPAPIAASSPGPAPAAAPDKAGRGAQAVCVRGGSIQGWAFQPGDSRGCTAQGQSMDTSPSSHQAHQCSSAVES